MMTVDATTSNATHNTAGVSYLYCGVPGLVVPLTKHKHSVLAGSLFLPIIVLYTQITTYIASRDYFYFLQFQSYFGPWWLWLSFSWSNVLLLLIGRCVIPVLQSGEYSHHLWPGWTFQWLVTCGCSKEWMFNTFYDQSWNKIGHSCLSSGGKGLCYTITFDYSCKSSMTTCLTYTTIFLVFVRFCFCCVFGLCDTLLIAIVFLNG